MKLFNIFRKKSAQTDTIPDFSQLSGKDFEFLLAGDIDLPQNCDDILTPTSFKCSKFIKNNWPYYKAGDDYYSLSIEMPGIQMTFNDEMTYQKAK